MWQLIVKKVWLGVELSVEARFFHVTWSNLSIGLTQKWVTKQEMSYIFLFIVKTKKNWNRFLSRRTIAPNSQTTLNSSDNELLLLFLCFRRHQGPSRSLSTRIARTRCKGRLSQAARHWVQFLPPIWPHTQVLCGQAGTRDARQCSKDHAEEGPVGIWRLDGCGSAPKEWASWIWVTTSDQVQGCNTKRTQAGKSICCSRHGEWLIELRRVWGACSRACSWTCSWAGTRAKLCLGKCGEIWSCPKGASCPGFLGGWWGTPATDLWTQAADTLGRWGLDTK